MRFMMLCFSFIHNLILEIILALVVIGMNFDIFRILKIKGNYLNYMMTCTGKLELH